MKRNSFRVGLATCIVAIACSAVAAQDFQKSYTLAAGGRISIRNSSGNIKVSGYNGSEVKVLGFKEGRDSDNLTVRDLSSPSMVDVRVHNPVRFCFGNCNGKIRFEVLVPSGTSFIFDEVSTASGNIEISGLTGELRAHSASGRIELGAINGNIQAHAASGKIIISSAKGNITATTASGAITALGIDGALECKAASGRIEAGILSLDAGAGVHLSSASGSISLSVPEKLDAEVDLSTHSGRLQTDVPVQISKMSHGKIQGTLGTGKGASHIRISSASGGISLRRNGPLSQS